MIMLHDHAHEQAHEHEELFEETHEHDHDHESFRNSVFESQESHPGEKAGEPKICFGLIDANHANRIVTQSDVQLFNRYFDDAVAAGWAANCSDDRLRMAGLFHQVIRIGRAKNIGATIAGAWRNRDSPDMLRGKPKALKLSHEDQDFASKLLRPKSQISDRKSEIANPLKVLPHCGDEVSPTELTRINTLRAGNLAVLMAMQ